MYLKDIGIQKRTVTAFSKKGIRTTEDLVRFAPKDYRDYTHIANIQSANPSVYSAFCGTLLSCEKRMAARWYLVMRILQYDGINIGITLFHDTYRLHHYQKMVGQEVVVFGKADYHPVYHWTIKNAYNICLLSEFTPFIEPVYSQVQGVSPEMFASVMNTAVDLQKETLEDDVLRRYKLIPYDKAVRMMHEPSSITDIRASKRRMLFDDLLYFSLNLKKRDRRNRKESPVFFKDFSSCDAFLKKLPYTLTEDQCYVLDEFRKSTSSGTRFHALIQGDVGCGKTVVAMAMMFTACGNGYQAVLAAPREVLARQHYEEVKKYADLLGFSSVFLYSGMNTKERKEALDGIRNGSVSVIVGTHSCLSESVVYASLGLTITDEEHLFGVKQKESLTEKALNGVHSVAMSATPIPRSLASILYGDSCEILSIRTMPPGRIPIQTATQISHKNVFPFMEKQIREGRQCYVVCPAIEENQEYDITAIETVEGQYRQYFEPRGISVGVVNGKMQRADIEKTIRAFTENRVHILISTTVIEVGVNVPNATVMVVEQADRFGLASLHQLRGRVGRASYPSYCILISNDTANARLSAMVKTTDGFKIAEADLQQRGSGDLLGVRQAGHNRFVEEMLQHPALAQITMEAADYCLRHGYGERFLDSFGDQAEQVGEDV